MSECQHSPAQKNKLKYQFKVQIRREEEGRENEKSCARYSLKQKRCLLITSHLMRTTKQILKSHTLLIQPQEVTIIIEDIGNWKLTKCCICLVKKTIILIRLQ